MAVYHAIIKLTVDIRVVFFKHNLIATPLLEKNLVVHQYGTGQTKYIHGIDYIKYISSF